MSVRACNADSLCSRSVSYLIRVYLWRIRRTQQIEVFSVVCQASIVLGMSPEYQKNGMARKSRNPFIAIEACSSCLTYGHFTHETKSPWPLHFKHSHWWKRRSRSKSASHYAWRTNWVCECKMDVKSTWIPTWHWMVHVSWTLVLYSKTASWR